MSTFVKYRRVLDAVYQQLLDAGDNLTKVNYWSAHHSRLWMLCFHSQDKK